MLDLYKNIKITRMKKGLSQEELALKTGYTDRSSIAKIESGKIDLPISKVEVFAKALGVTIDELTEGTFNSNESMEESAITRRAELPNGLVIAAHHDNDNDFTDEEWDSIIRFVEFVKSKEKK